MKEERNYFFDNVKAFLIILVVAGHYLEFLLQEDFFKTVYILIYSFHMPLFAFVTGFFSKGGKLFDEGAKKVIFQYVVFQLAYVIFTGVILLAQPQLIEEVRSQASASGTFETIAMLFTPYWIMWYMLSVFFWRLLLQLFKKRRRFMIVAFVIGLLFGYVGVYGRMMSLQRTFALFPFFLMGYFISYEKVYRYTKSQRSKVLFGVFLICLPWVYLYVDKIDYELFYYADNYYALGQVRLGLLFRMATYGISLLMGGLFILCISHRKRIYTAIGEKTLYIYILHGFLVKALWGIGFFEKTAGMPVYYQAVMVICLTAATVTVLSRRYVVKWMDKVAPKRRRM